MCSGATRLSHDMSPLSSLLRLIQCAVSCRALATALKSHTFPRSSQTFLFSSLRLLVRFVFQLFVRIFIVNFYFITTEVKSSGTLAKRNRASSKNRNLDSSRKLLEEIGKDLGISGDNLEAWYNITEAELLRHGGITLGLGKRSSLSSLVKSVFPEHQWDSSRFLQFVGVNGESVLLCYFFLNFTFLFLILYLGNLKWRENKSGRLKGDAESLLAPSW
jgi:hypothetical protein